MPKLTQAGPKKEKSSEKRKRRENISVARKQAQRFVIPVVVLFFALLAAFLVYRFGMGKTLTPEARERLRNQRKIAKMLREHGYDYDKMRREMKDAKPFGDTNAPNFDKDTAFGGTDPLASPDADSVEGDAALANDDEVVVE